MQLMMYIGNDLIEAIPINDKDLQVPGYLGKFKRKLKEKYNSLIRTTADQPEFLVCNPVISPEITSAGSTYNKPE